MLPLPNGVQSILASGQNPNNPALDSGAPDAQQDTPAPGTMAWKMQQAGIPTPSPDTLSTSSNASQSSSSPLVTSIAKAAGEAAKVNPNPTAPGAWARNLLGGVVSSLGDAAAAGRDVKGGSGALGGIEKTFAARSQRLALQKQQQFENNLKMSAEQREDLNAQATRAYTAAQTYHLQKQTGLVDLQTTEAAQNIKDKTVSNGKMATDAFRKNHTVQDNISEDDLKKMYKDYSQSPEKGANGKPLQFYDKYTVNQTGYEKKTGPDGKEYDSPTYSLITKSSNPVEVDQASHDFLKRTTGKDIPVGTQLSGDLFDSQMTQGMQIAQAHSIMDEFIKKDIDFSNDIALNNAMKTAGPLMAQDVSDPYVGLQQGLKNADLHIQQAQKAIQQAQKTANPEALEQAKGILAQAQKEKNDLNTVINSPKLEAARLKHADKIEALKMKAQEKNEELSQVNGARMAEGYDFPSDLSKRSKNLEAQKNAADAYSLSKYGHPVNWGVLEADYKYAQRGTTQDTLNLVKSVAEPGGSLDIALSAADKLPNITDVQVLNKVFSKVGGQFGNQATSDFHTALYGLADEYAKIMGGGTASLGAFDHAMNLLKDSYTKGQMAGAAQILQQDMASRARGIIGNNIFLVRKYADNPDARATAILQGKDPWATEKAAGAFRPNSDNHAATQAPEKGDVKQYQGATYTFDGTQYVKNKTP